ncbi:head GIN domain-containing protein [Mucilaginibacter gotjawali]|uniref:Small secreted protein n=2 Tax=Mucilaginibacter gotjawali TaxID=1550579 RepID=A0A839SGP5_9SPHI|nr:head GIN domain-containing protein [Mucilaginibacter gotjawali]MBB3056473.1 putative small secreted protein [Mucilaginibacter gotjawali]BAU55180.1 hypothetical protein MgSA37_03361 [Mucilaginibacter gotjawali]
MMKKIQITILALVAGFTAFGLSACNLNCIHGSGHQVSEDRNVGQFSRISISGGYKVTLKQDSTFAIKITADDNLLKYIKTNLQGDKLRIYSKKSFCNGLILVTIGVKNLEEIKASGAVEVDGDGKLVTRDLAINLSGATKVNLDLNAANVTTTGSGATELNLKGQATSHNINISGVGHVYALDFVVGTCGIESSGASHCEVNVLNNLNVHSSGASEVKYKGHPSISNDKSGASSIEQVN